MGCDDGEDDQKPVRTVYVDAFYMDIHPVTNAQYQAFIEATGRRKLFWWAHAKYNQPVMDLDWDDAVAYCKWAGKRLPTEAEWERAARGGLEGKKYPWGDGIDEMMANYGWNARGPTRVGQYEPNGYGLYDMAGNVWEWCHDWYGEDYYREAPQRNPTGPREGTFQVIRGGDWSSDASWLGCGFRFNLYPIHWYYSIGFRGVQSVSRIL